jgi:sugar-specific transcriptional regulator TrmB
MTERMEMANTLQDGRQALVELGLTNLEAEVYTCLLREKDATGYRVAAALGKPVANTYKALQSLAAKGAIVTDEGQSRICRAVPPSELLSRLERAFDSRKTRAEKALAKMPGASADDRVFQMRSREQVFERCRLLLENAEQVVLLDVFPGPLAELVPEIATALNRGVEVYIKAYQATDIEATQIAVTPDGKSVTQRWPGEWLNMVADGAEFVQAFLTRDGEHVHQAVWSESAYLAWVYHSALWSELALAEVETRLNTAGGGNAAVWLREIKSRMTDELPGFRTLMDRFGTAAVSASSQTQKKSRKIK